MPNPLILDAQALPALVPHRPHGALTQTFGHTVVVAGSVQNPGAGLLTALGALRSGTGQVFWATDMAVLQLATLTVPELHLRPRDDYAHRQPTAWAKACADGAQALVVGPGLGSQRAAKATVLALLEQGGPAIVLDGDALAFLADDEALWRPIGPTTVLTPDVHHMARLLGTHVERVLAEPERAARQVAQSRQCTVVLRGPTLLVADPDGALATTMGEGRSALAHAGTSDVLAGLVGGLLAQGLTPSHAARLGVLVFVLAADRATEHTGAAGVLATDVAQAVGQVWRQAL
jgi:hydroxyethylthiazole kinase-like uncharacterized protein yjeF